MSDTIMNRSDDKLFGPLGNPFDIAKKLEDKRASMDAAGKIKKAAGEIRADDQVAAITQKPAVPAPWSAAARERDMSPIRKVGLRGEPGSIAAGNKVAEEYLKWGKPQAGLQINMSSKEKAPDNGEDAVPGNEPEMTEAKFDDLKANGASELPFSPIWGAWNRTFAGFPEDQTIQTTDPSLLPEDRVRASRFQDNEYLPLVHEADRPGRSPILSLAAGLSFGKWSFGGTRANRAANTAEFDMRLPDGSMVGADDMRQGRAALDEALKRYYGGDPAALEGNVVEDQSGGLVKVARRRDDSVRGGYAFRPYSLYDPEAGDELVTIPVENAEAAGMDDGSSPRFIEAINLPNGNTVKLDDDLKAYLADQKAIQDSLVQTNPGFLSLNKVAPMSPVEIAGKIMEAKDKPKAIAENAQDIVPWVADAALGTAPYLVNSKLATLLGASDALVALQGYDPNSWNADGTLQRENMTKDRVVGMALTGMSDPLVERLAGLKPADLPKSQTKGLFDSLDRTALGRISKAAVGEGLEELPSSLAGSWADGGIEHYGFEQVGRDSNGNPIFAPTSNQERMANVGKDMADSAFAGALMGGAMRGGSEAVSKASAPKQEKTQYDRLADSAKIRGEQAKRLKALQKHYESER